MKNWRPYQISLWISKYLKYRCQLCHFHPSYSGIYMTDTASQLQPNQKKVHSILQMLDTGILCQHCHQSIHWLPKPLSVELNNGRNLTIQHCSYYQHPINQVILRFKFDQDMTMVPILVHMISQLPPPTGCTANNSVILPMPTTDKRLQGRGFNPLSIIVPYLSKHWGGIPVWEGVQRIDDTVSQRGLSRRQRFQNIKGAFSLMETIPADKVILFDDVATTGASLRELANTLLSINKSIPLSAYCLAHGNSMF